MDGLTYRISTSTKSSAWAETITTVRPVWVKNIDTEARTFFEAFTSKTTFAENATRFRGKGVGCVWGRNGAG